MSDRADSSAAGADNSAADGEDETPVRTGRGRSRVIAMIATGIVLVGAGVSAAIMTSASSGGASTPATAVNQLLDAAQNSDLLGALDAIAPGEREAIQPGLLGLIQQLQRLNILSSSAKPADIKGLSIRFQGVQTSTDYLSSTVAEVRLTRGSVTASVNGAQLPVGSFVQGLVGASKIDTKTSKTSPVTTGTEGIATIEVGGTWYVSLGYTIAIDSLLSAHRSDALPPSGSVIQPTPSNSAEGAVTAFMDDLTSFNLHGLIGDLAPGETAALQSYASLFSPKANAAIARIRDLLSVTLSGYSLQSEPIGAMTLIRVIHPDFTVKVDGIELSLKGDCITESYLGKTKVTCNSKSAAANRIMDLLPASLRPLVTRLEGAQPDIGFMTVQEGSGWYISPTATFLQAINATASLFSPQDLSAIVSFAENPAAGERQLQKLEQSLLPLISGLS